MRVSDNLYLKKTAGGVFSSIYILIFISLMLSRKNMFSLQWNKLEFSTLPA